MENRKEFSEGGICHIVCECALPDLPEGKAGVRMQKVLSQIKESFFLSAEKALPSLSEKYDKNSDPHKKLRHRPLSFSLAFSFEERKKCFSVSVSIRLSRSGRTLSQKKGEVRFDKQSGYLLKKAKLDI
jgi:hypothetical protein